MLARQAQAFLQEIEVAIGRCAGAEVSRTATGISVRGSGPHGFDMAIMVEDERYAVYLDNWTEEFASDELARRTFEAALAGKARLRVDTLAGRQWRWTLETLDLSGRWVPESTVGHAVWRFWGRQASYYLRNTFPRHLAGGNGESTSAAT